MNTSLIEEILKSNTTSCKIRNWHFSVDLKYFRTFGTWRLSNFEVTSASQNNRTPLSDTTLLSHALFFFSPSLFYLFFVILSSSFSVRFSLLLYHICLIFSILTSFQNKVAYFRSCGLSPRPYFPYDFGCFRQDRCGVFLTYRTARHLPCPKGQWRGFSSRERVDTRRPP